MKFEFKLNECKLGDDEKYNYIYLVTNNKKNKFYGGVSYSKHHPSDRNYIGSSLNKDYWEDYSDHPEFFTLEILNYYSTKDEAVKAENKFITREKVYSNKWYNDATGGKPAGLFPAAIKSIETRFGKLGKQFSTPMGIRNRVETQRLNKVGCFRPGHLEKSRWMNAKWWNRFDLQGNWIMSHKGQLGMDELNFDITMCKRNKDPYHVWVEKDKSTFEDELDKKLSNAHMIEYIEGTLKSVFYSARSITACTKENKSDYIKHNPDSNFVFK